MPYTPSIDDIPQNAGYTPSMADIPSAAPNTPSNLMSAVGVGGAQAIGGGISDIGSLLQHGLGVPGQGTPGVGAINQFGQNIAQQAPQMYGLTNPSTAQTGIENVMHYAPMAYGLGSAALDIGSLAGRGLSALYKATSPELKMNNILQNIGGGQGLEENSTSLANDIYTASQKAIGNSANKYQPILNEVGNNQIYPSGSIERKGIADITGSGALGRANSKYLNLPSAVTDSFSSDAQDLHNTFYNNPTFNNAKNLSSQLGNGIGQLEKMQAAKTLDTAGVNQLSAYNKAYSAINNDMSSYLQTNRPDLDAAYQDAKTDYKTNVVPYNADPSIRDIASGKTTNPQNISSIFANPEQSTLKVASDLPPQSINKIIYDKLATPQATRSPEAFNNALNNLDKQGLSSYVQPGLSDQIDDFRGAMKNKEIVSSSLGALGGAALASHFGPASDIIGGLIGQKAFPWLLSKTRLGSTAGAIGKAASKANTE